MQEITVMPAASGDPTSCTLNRHVLCKALGFPSWEDPKDAPSEDRIMERIMEVLSIARESDKGIPDVSVDAMLIERGEHPDVRETDFGYAVKLAHPYNDVHGERIEVIEVRRAKTRDIRKFAHLPKPQQPYYQLAQCAKIGNRSPIVIEEIEDLDVGDLGLVMTAFGFLLER